jgi:hypothetical protein
MTSIHDLPFGSAELALSYRPHINDTASCDLRQIMGSAPSLSLLRKWLPVKVSMYNDIASPLTSARHRPKWGKIPSTNFDDCPVPYALNVGRFK